MKGFTISWIAWAFDNALVLFVGGYLGHRFGEPVEAWFSNLLSKFKK